MDTRYLSNILKDSLKNKCPQLPQEIIDEYIDITFYHAAWATYGDNKDIYIIGIAENKHDFYYIGCNENLDIQLISCALDIKQNKDRQEDYIVKFDEDFQKWCNECTRVWTIIRNNVNSYFENNQNDKLLFFEDHVLTDEHIVYDNEEHTEYHIEKI